MAERASIGAVLLAAGASARFGPGDKLLAPLNGKPLVAHAAAAVAAFPFAQRVLVVGGNADKIARAAGASAFQIVRNQNYKSGMGGSIAAGVGALSDRLDAVVIALADMPHIGSAHFQALADAFSAPEDIRAFRKGGGACPPVLFGRAHRPALLELRGDRGAREILRRRPKSTLLISATGNALDDIDTAEDLTAFNEAE